MDGCRHHIKDRLAVWPTKHLPAEERREVGVTWLAPAVFVFNPGLPYTQQCSYGLFLILDAGFPRRLHDGKLCPVCTQLLSPTHYRVCYITNGFEQSDKEEAPGQCDGRWIRVRPSRPEEARIFPGVFYRGASAMGTASRF